MRVKAKKGNQLKHLGQDTGWLCKLHLGARLQRALSRSGGVFLVTPHEDFIRVYIQPSHTLLKAEAAEEVK